MGIGDRNKRVRTRTKPIKAEAKKNRKMATDWPWGRDAVELGTALRSIVKMLRNAVPKSPGDRF